MKTSARIAVIAALLLVVIAVVVLKNHDTAASPAEPSQAAAPAGAAAVSPQDSPKPAAAAAQPAATASLPRLVDLGSTTCIPCKMMMPVLKELKSEYAGRLVVEFIDINEIPAAQQKFAIRVIPTQVFLDTAGKELYRHEGFFDKQDILAKWKQLGVELNPKAEATSSPAGR